MGLNLADLMACSGWFCGQLAKILISSSLKAAAAVPGWAEGAGAAVVVASFDRVCFILISKQQRRMVVAQLGALVLRQAKF